ncbi:hypothetical protein [Pandoravirus japonicus]|uniref:Uncharacterized protein n=1 Tax=Pandoravirus japonicus TaxID=2823154 RepID=A0A811BP64_9VIRU|nr:hypothetical protein [Pandoravirus japonicus]
MLFSLFFLLHLLAAVVRNSFFSCSRADCERLFGARAQRRANRCQTATSLFFRGMRWRSGDGGDHMPNKFVIPWATPSHSLDVFFQETSLSPTDGTFFCRNTQICPLGRIRATGTTARLKKKARVAMGAPASLAVGNLFFS